MALLETIEQPVSRAEAVRRAKLLNRITIGWNGIEGVVALIAGAAASSVSLIGFGLDSGIEVSAALVLTWRLAQEAQGDAGANQVADRRAQLGVALSFLALALYVGITATRGLLQGDEPDVSVVGMLLAALSLAVMPLLARAKRRVAAQLGSRAADAEAHQTNLCAMLSAGVLVGLGANALFGWWWADAVAAIGIAGVSGWMAYQTWNADSLEDTCCS